MRWRITRLRFLFILTLLPLAACSGLADLREQTNKFDQSVVAYAAKQTSYFDAVVTAECNNKFYDMAYNRAMGTSNAVNLTLTCKSEILPPARLERRHKLMEALKLYADQSYALTSDNLDKDFLSSSQSLASNLKAWIQTVGAPETAHASEVEAAMLALMDAFLDAEREKDVREAAQKIAPALRRVAADLQVENTQLADDIDDQMNLLRANLTILAAREKEGRGLTGFYNLLKARELLRRSNPLGTPEFVPSEDDKTGDPHEAAKQLNALLEALVRANDSLTEEPSPEGKAVIDDFFARAHAAQTMATALAE